MNDLEFYKKLQQVLRDEYSEAIYQEVCNRLKQLEAKEINKYWNNLSVLIEDTVRAYEKLHSNYLDVTIDLDNNTITITNNLL